MSVVTASRSLAPGTRRRGHGPRAAFSLVLDRLAASPLDSPVLRAMGAPRSTSRPAGPRPAWWLVVGPDAREPGSRRTR
ncbi:hypothetical protein [Kitasatospora sp. NPDC017646]|uniref:hypothetical protein n=1 Tax=Kitasatospora sp. NPDC017646 TaxID=3364024 RepID=UPI0037A7DC83